MELAVTAALLVALAAVAALASLVGALVAGVTDDGRTCDARCTVRVEVGAHLGAAGPWAWWCLTLAAVVVRTARRRATWWVPLVAVPLVVLTVVLARALALSGPPP